MSSFLIVQLSDIHLLEGDLEMENRSGAIAAALQPLYPLCSKVVLAVTGDITQSGKRAQFQLAESLIRSVADEVLKRHGSTPAILTVPGNHDADFDSPKAKIRSRILKQLKTEPADGIDREAVEECTSVFREYHEFANRIETESITVKSPIWRTATVMTDGHAVEFHCVNNAWSCEVHTEPGTLGFPMKLHSDCGDGSGALRVLLMHHPSHWIAARQYREFRRFSRECAEICFTGHEHEANAGQNFDSETATSLYIEGAVLQDRADSSSSGFNATLIDFEQKTAETLRFSFDKGQYIGVGAPFVVKLPGKVDVVGLTRDWTEFISDLGSNVVHPAKESLELQDLYVYPELEQAGDSDESPVMISAAELAAELPRDTRSLLIKGDQGSGKTALLKCLYAEAISAGLYPVYVNGARLKSSSQREVQKLIERCVNEQYGGSHIQPVLQAPPTKRVLLLDNLDRYEFPDRFVSEVLSNFSKQFAKIVATADTAFDLKEALLSDELASLREFEQMRLQEFGFKLRHQLVSRWFALSDRSLRSNHDVEVADKLVSQVVGRGLVPAYPLYVLIILQSIEMGREGELENSALGHYYEYMILGALDSKVRHEHVHEILNYCSQFAWYLHSVKLERVSEVQLRRFHDEFERRFDLEINFEARKRLLLEANLFLELGQEFGFRYPYSYYFFLGRYLSSNLSDQEARAFVYHCCSNLHFRENGNAMLFLAHHSSDPLVYEALKEAVDSKFVQVAPLEFQKDTEALDQLVDSVPALVFHQSMQQEVRILAQEEDHRIEQHFDEVANEPRDISAAEEQRVVLELIAEVNGLIKGIEILGTALKSNFGTIDAQSKQRLIDSLFRGGLRGLRVFVEAFSNVPEYFLAELATIVEQTQSSSMAERERAVKVRIFNLIGRFSFWFIRRVGSSVGSKSMAPALARYVADNDTVANQLVAMASTLETPGRIPFKDLQTLNGRVSKTAFAQSVLRWIVYTRIYMYKTSEAEKQQVCEEIGIRLAQQHAIDYKTRQTKKLAPKRQR